MAAKAPRQQTLKPDQGLGSPSLRPRFLPLHWCEALPRVGAGTRTTPLLQGRPAAAMPGDSVLMGTRGMTPWGRRGLVAQRKPRVPLTEVLGYQAYRAPGKIRGTRHRGGTRRARRYPSACGGGASQGATHSPPLQHVCWPPTLMKASSVWLIIEVNVDGVLPLTFCRQGFFL